MNWFEIVAHRGVPGPAAENTLPAFERAIALGADAVEMDIRLTADHIPVVYHYYYLHINSPLQGPIFQYPYAALQQARVSHPDAEPDGQPIPTFSQVMEAICGRIGLEIEIKGPERECIPLIAAILRRYRPHWDSIEVTSFEPAFLQGIKEQCPGLTTDLLFPRSEPWMGLDVVAYQALHLARLAGVRAVHLHPSQLTPEVCQHVRDGGVAIHAWDVNDEAALQRCRENYIPRICTDDLKQVLAFRERSA